MNKTSKGRMIGYALVTGLVVLSQTAAGVMDVLGVGPAVEGIAALGYPAYLLMILGPCKIAGALVLALPKFPRLKEWAYAGFTIDFLGASASHVLHGDGPELIFPALIAFGILMGSYFLRPASRRM